MGASQLWVAWATGLVGLVLLSGTAVAGEIRDPNTGFSVKVNAPGAKVCVVLPKEARDAGCAGLDVDRLEAGLGSLASPPIGFALFRFDDASSSILTVVQASTRTSTSEAILATILGGEDEMEKAFRGFSVHVRADEARDGARYEIFPSNEVNVIRYAIDVDLPAPHPQYMASTNVTYLVAGRDSTVMLTFSSPPRAAAATRAMSEAIASTVRWPGSKDPLFNRSRAYTVGYTIGRPVFVIGIFFTAVASVVFLLRSRRRPA